MHGCDIWWARPVAPQRRPELVDLLDEHERERLGRFRRPADRARYLAAHALTRLVLGHRLGIAPAAVALDRTCRCGEQHGKPRLAAGDGPHFSLTHAGDVVGVAVHGVAPVGLDAEQLRPLGDLAGMARQAWSPTELARGGRVDTAAFLTVWTRKEALLKASGDGLAAPMAGITLSRPDEPAALREWAGPAAPGGRWWVRDLRPPAPEHLAAVAGAGADPPVVTVTDGEPLLCRGGGG